MAASLQQLHHLLRPPSSWVLIKPLCITAPTLRIHKKSLQIQSFFVAPYSSPPRPRLFCNSSSSSLAFLQTQSLDSLPEDEISYLHNSEDEQEQRRTRPKTIELETVLETVVDDGRREPIKASVNAAKSPILTVKEKKELAAYAHSLGKKLKCQQVGKSGVTSSVAAAFVENLEANELLKLKVHNSCPGELADVVKQLEEATGSVVVGQIGRAVILYKPSLTKLKAEEKKKQAQRVFVRKGLTLKSFEPNKGQVQRLSGRGRRGNSRL